MLILKIPLHASCLDKLRLISYSFKTVSLLFCNTNRSFFKEKNEGTFYLDLAPKSYCWCVSVTLQSLKESFHIGATLVQSAFSKFAALKVLGFLRTPHSLFSAIKTYPRSRRHYRYLWLQLSGWKSLKAELPIMCFLHIFWLTRHLVARVVVFLTL